MIMDRDTARDRSDQNWSGQEAGDGMSTNRVAVSQEERAARYGQQAATVLLTGLTGTGKSSIARALERTLFDAGRAVMMIDGELMRQGMNRDLGYSVEDRSENLRRSAHLAKMLNDSGLLCIAAFVAPSQSVRDRVADTVGRDRFLVVHLTAEESTRRARDTKGHYEQADAGKLIHFPGVTAPYEAPEAADLVLDTGKLSVEECVERLLELLRQKKFIR